MITTVTLIKRGGLGNNHLILDSGYDLVLCLNRIFFHQIRDRIFVQEKNIPFFEIKWLLMEKPALCAIKLFLYVDVSS